MNHSILALDLSLSSTGWARHSWKQISSGVIQGTGTGMERFAKIQDGLSPLLSAADLVVLEGYSFASRGRAIISLGELGGVVRYRLHLKGIPYVEVPPSCRAKYATGKGNAGKDAVLAEAIRRLDYGGHSHDEADALWLLAMTLDRYGIHRSNVPKSHRAGLEKVPWPATFTRRNAAERDSGPQATSDTPEPSQGRDSGPPAALRLSPPQRSLHLCSQQ